ncbi:MAG: hypothetical protein J6J24_02960 [Clostridia bacterium]|nr:hypothetical protein [Clostridia bacterium]
MTILENLFELIEKSQEQINYLEKRLEEEKQNKEKMLNQKIPIRLSDFVGELSKLSGVNILDMYIKITTNIFVDSERESFEMEYAKKRQEGHNLEIQIFGHKTANNAEVKPFKLLLYFPLDFEKLQADRKPLLEHCTARRTKGTASSLPQKEIVVDKNIGDIVCEFSPKQLMMQDSSLFTPKAMLIEAVGNCLENGKTFKETEPNLENKSKEKTF